MAQSKQMSLKHHYFAGEDEKVMPIINHALNNYDVIYAYLEITIQARVMW